MPIESRKPILGPETARIITDNDARKASIDMWASRINASGELPLFATIFGRTNTDPLSILSYNEWGYSAGNYGHYFDCANSLVLAGSDQASACIGFDIVPFQSTPFSFAPPGYKKQRGIVPGDVIISQIQSTYEPRNWQLLQGWRWEQALVTLVVDWVDSVDLGNIYVWSGELIGEDYPLTREEMKKFEARYNGTARALGFKKNGGGIYMLDRLQLQPHSGAKKV